MAETTPFVLPSSSSTMTHLPSLNRRQFIQTSSLLGAGILTGLAAGCQSGEDLNAFIQRHIEADGAPGFQAALVKGNRLLWSNGFGYADLDNKTPMTADTIQNIGSISKTVTATAVMQLWEEGAFKLDDDINGYLPFTVRNPRFPAEPITFRQLLTHRSSITDGPSYGDSYACGDPVVPLQAWIAGYFSPDGPYYDAEANFHLWKPGTTDPPTPPRAYSNVAFGLLGVLVEQISQSGFETFTQERIFAPLAMHNTGWHLRDVDLAGHATLYSYLEEGYERPADEPFESFLPQSGLTEAHVEVPGYFPHCPYSFYNYPDGLTRTSANDLSRFLRAYIQGGTLEGKRILQASTIDLMLSDQHYERGLCWVSRDRRGDLLWGHSGGDPGVVTVMDFRPADGVGVIMMYNYDSPGSGASEIMTRLLEEGKVDGNF